MTTYRVRVALAEDEHGGTTFPTNYYAGPTLVPVAKLRLHDEPLIVKAGSPDEAADRAKAVCNIARHGWAARYRDAGHRSISVGDVLFLTDDAGTIARQVLPYRWGRVDVRAALELTD